MKNSMTLLFAFSAFLAIACEQAPPSNANESVFVSEHAAITPALMNTSTKQPADSSPVKKGPVLGIDVSHFQSNVNWVEVKQAGISYVYSKATQGTRDTDPKFKRNHVETKNAGLLHGAYHFYVAGEDPVKQAELFLKAIMPITEHSIPPVLDLEQGGMKPGIVKGAFHKDVLTWLKKVEAVSGIRPIIYTNHPFGNEYLDHPDFGSYHLWIAEYGVAMPKIPTAWKTKGWLMWQRSERGKIEGAIGNVDHDLLNGDVQVLKSLVVR
jgi:lysozyme